MTKIWVTEIQAMSPTTGELTKYCGPEVKGISAKDAQAFCENNGLGYCKVIGELVAEVPCKSGTYEPDWKNQKDYDIEQYN